jgi:hypothetical protein
VLQVGCGCFTVQVCRYVPCAWLRGCGWQGAARLRWIQGEAFSSNCVWRPANMPHCLTGPASHKLAGQFNPFAHPSYPARMGVAFSAMLTERNPSITKITHSMASHHEKRQCTPKQRRANSVMATCATHPIGLHDGPAEHIPARDGPAAVLSQHVALVWQHAVRDQGCGGSRRLRDLWFWRQPLVGVRLVQAALCRLGPWVPPSSVRHRRNFQHVEISWLSAPAWKSLEGRRAPSDAAGGTRVARSVPRARRHRSTVALAPGPTWRARYGDGRASVCATVLLCESGQVAALPQPQRGAAAQKASRQRCAPGAHKCVYVVCVVHVLCVCCVCLCVFVHAHRCLCISKRMCVCGAKNKVRD